MKKEKRTIIETFYVCTTGSNPHGDRQLLDQSNSLHNSQILIAELLEQGKGWRLKRLLPPEL